jgi:hypothetical protein
MIPRSLQRFRLWRQFTTASALMKKAGFTIIFALTFGVLTTIGCIDRTNKQLYIDLLGRPIENSTRLINSRDFQDFDGGSAYLYFQTTSAELNRILLQGQYSKKIIAKQRAVEIETIKYSGSIPKWWTPSRLGDSCIQFQNVDEHIDRAQLIYCTFDSTTVYYIDNRW